MIIIICRCTIFWNYSLTTNLSPNRLQISLESKEILNINITSTLTELYQQVKDSWVQDYYTSSGKMPVSPAYRRRSPFVPFTLKNETGSQLLFATLISDHNELDDASSVDTKWIKVAPGDSVPFSFKSHKKIRHSDSHKMQLHQISVEVDGYERVTPITVDKVGVYFRLADRKFEKV